MLRKIDLLSHEECDLVREGIYELRQHWIHHDPRREHPFYTLGYSTYDAQNNLDDYYKMAPQVNRMMREKFGWLYDRLQERLTEALNCRMFYDDQLALPGFHVLLASKAFEKSFAAIHWDMQHVHLKWEGKDVSFENTISYTAAIRIPETGAGLNIWDLNIKELDTRSTEDLENVFRTGPHQYFPYEKGKMVLHSGDTVHQIAPMRDLKDTDERITLQGWGLPSRGGYLLYW